MQKITQKSDKIRDLARRKSKFSGLETRNFSSQLAMTQSFDESGSVLVSEPKSQETYR